jgi:tRNA/tmRNA/rRNA uracil-C5-methylase (TrmA/RlmC/RlmD family)
MRIGDALIAERSMVALPPRTALLNLHDVQTRSRRMTLSACPHRPPCDGCPRFGASGIARAARETLQELARVRGLPTVTEHSGTLFGFRHRARLAIRGRRGAPKMGLFEAGSHHVVHIPNCRVQHPLINEVAGIVRGALAATQVTCYSDRAHLGLARYLQVVIERRSGAAQVVLVVNTTSVEPLVQCLELIRVRLGSRLHSLWLNFNTQPNNVILGSQFHHYCGPATVVEEFGGAAVHYPPGAFGQSNLEIAGKIVGHIRERIPPGARVTEFYAGVGAIGLSVLDQVGAMTLNEVNPASLEGLQFGMAQLTADQRNRIQVVPGTAGAASDAARDAQLVIVDPPRKGLDPQLSQFLAMQPPQQLIYVSCNLESFLNDVQLLQATGALVLAELTAFNLMPFTDHVETVAVFRRGLSAGGSA